MVFVFVTYKVVAVIFVPEPHNLIGKFKGGGKVLPHKQKLSVLVSVKHLNWSECEFSSGCLPATHDYISFFAQEIFGQFFWKKITIMHTVCNCFLHACSILFPLLQRASDIIISFVFFFWSGQQSHKIFVFFPFYLLTFGKDEMSIDLSVEDRTERL